MIKKTPKTKIIQCKQCSIEFETWQGNAKYCSYKCSNLYQAIKAKHAKEEALKTGIIFGMSVENYYYNVNKRRAQKNKLEFTLTTIEFKELWKKPCTYCKQPIQWVGIDRIDSKKGYTVNNVCPCCTVCNLMKRHMSPEIFINHCKLISDNNNVILSI